MLKMFFSFLKDNPLARGSLILFVGSFLAGVLSYIFNAIMGRMLGPEDYGAFASLVSLTYITGVPAGTIAVVVAKKMAELQAKNEMTKSRPFVGYVAKQSAIFGVVVFLIFLVLIPLIMGFLKIESFWAVLILGLSLLVSFVSAVPSGGLRGLEKFFEISWSSIFSALTRIGLGVLFVLVGWRVAGGLFAALCADILVTLVIFHYLRLPKERTVLAREDTKLSSFALPVFFVTLFMAVLYNADVVLAKHFLDTTNAGYYAILSLLGKIIFFGTASIGVVIFPITAKNHSLGLDNSRILKLSLWLTFIASAMVTAIYFVFPDLVIKILFGASYLPVSPYVGLMGIVFVFYSLLNILVSYALSCGRTGISYILAGGALVEILALFLFHGSLGEIIYAMILVMAMTLGGLVIYLKYGRMVKKWIL